MAVAVFLDFPGITGQQYDDICRELNDGKPLGSLTDWPENGVMTHLDGPSTTGGWRVVDVWESEEAFRRFNQKLGPVLDKAGIDMAEPLIFHISKVVTE